MKIKVNNYTFNKASKTVTFTDFSSIRLDSILLITNVTDNVIIYNFADPLLGGSVSNNVLTLTYDTSSMADADKLQIFYDDPEINFATEERQYTFQSFMETMQELVSRLAIFAGMANSGAPALRVIPVGSTAVTGSVTATVASTSITNFGTGYPAKEMSDDINNYTVVMSNIVNVTT